MAQMPRSQVETGIEPQIIAGGRTAGIGIAVRVEVVAHHRGRHAAIPAFRTDVATRVAPHIQLRHGERETLLASVEAGGRTRNVRGDVTAKAARGKRQGLLRGDVPARCRLLGFALDAKQIDAQANEQVAVVAGLRARLAIHGGEGHIHAVAHQRAIDDDVGAIRTRQHHVAALETGKVHLAVAAARQEACVEFHRFGRRRQGRVERRRSRIGHRRTRRAQQCSVDKKAQALAWQSKRLGLPRQIDIRRTRMHA